MEAREFRDAYGQFTARDAAILGISADQPATQQKFKAKERLPFTLLCDVDKRAAGAFGISGRTTFLISEDGRIARVFAPVKPKGHAAEVLGAL